MFGSRQKKDLNGARQQFRRRMAAAVQKAITDEVWRQREHSQGWVNVDRLNRFLAVRRVRKLDPSATMASVRVGMTLGPEATPERVMVEIRKIDEALRTGDFEEVAAFGGGNLTP